MHGQQEKRDSQWDRGMFQPWSLSWGKTGAVGQTVSWKETESGTRWEAEGTFWSICRNTFLLVLQTVQDINGGQCVDQGKTIISL